MHDIESQFLDTQRRYPYGSSVGGRHLRTVRCIRCIVPTRATRSKKHIWYVLHADKPPSGAYGDYKLGIEGKWTPAQAEMSSEERAHLKKRMAETARERAAYLLNDNAAAHCKTEPRLRHPYPPLKACRYSPACDC